MVYEHSGTPDKREKEKKTDEGVSLIEKHLLWNMSLHISV